MPTEIELVVFDMSGTTVDDGEAVADAFRATLAAVGVPIRRDDANAVMGLPKPEAIRLLIDRAGRPDLHDRIDAIHADFVARMIRGYAEGPSLKEVPGAGAVFARLRAAGIKVAINTGFSRAIAQVILDRLGWERAGLIDATIASDEAPRGRPHADMIRALMGRLGVADARRVAKVGDTPADLAEGHAAGCGRVVGVTGGTHTRAELEPHRPTDLIGSVAELPALLGLEPARPAP